MTQITLAAVSAAFDAQLQGFTAGGDVNLEGTRYQPQAGRPYLSSRLAAYQRTPAGIGPVTGYQVAGSYQVNVNRPATEGAAAARAVAAQLTVLFARGTAIALATGHALTIENASEQPLIEGGDWLTVPVVVSWFCTE